MIRIQVTTPDSEENEAYTHEIEDGNSLISVIQAIQVLYADVQTIYIEVVEEPQ